MNTVNSIISPNGLYRLDIKQVESKYRNINSPTLIDHCSGKLIQGFGDYWDVQNGTWQDGNTLVLQLLHYADRSVDFTLTLYLDTKTATLGASGYDILHRGEMSAICNEMAWTNSLRTLFY